MKKRVLLTLCGITALAAAIVCLPVSREINTTAAATEYRLDDPAYAVEHTVTGRNCFKIQVRRKHPAT